MTRLVLIGGNEWQADDGIDRYLAEAAQGPVGLVAFAREEPQTAFEHMQDRYSGFDAEVRLVNSEAELEGLRLVYLCGGDPDRLYEALNGPFGDALSYAWRQGELALAGSSAGAMVLFEQMLARGSWMRGDTATTPALGWVKGPVFAPHWNTADAAWIGQLKNAFTEAVGLDENTGLAWTGDTVEVIGVGEAHIWKDGQMTDVASGTALTDEDLGTSLPDFVADEFEPEDPGSGEVTL